MFYVSALCGALCRKDNKTVAKQKALEQFVRCVACKRRVCRCVFGDVYKVLKYRV